MRKKINRPEFPVFLARKEFVFGQGNHLLSPRLLASIPMYTFHEEGSPKRKELEDLYWKQLQKEYDELKELYDKHVFVGMVWKGNTSASAKITKIAITPDRAYVCFKSSDQHVAEVAAINAKSVSNGGLTMKPIKAGRYSISGFLSGISNGTIKIVSVPDPN